MELTDRKKRVLRAIVETYINTAEPVGHRPAGWIGCVRRHHSQ